MGRKQILFVFKIAISLGLIALLLYFVEWQEAFDAIVGANPFWLMASGLLVIAIVLMDGLRLCWMIPMPELKRSDHLRVALQSAFVLQLGFGIAAGDAYRTARYAARSGKIMQPVVHIIAARLVGVSSIAIVALAISFWVLVTGDGTAQELGLRIVKLVALASLIALVIVAGFIIFAKFRGSATPAWFGAINEAFGSITARVWALSLFMVLVRGLSFACVLLAIGQVIAIYIPVLASNTATLTTLLPFAFGGLGIREGALAGTVALFGIPFSMALSAAIIMRIVVILASCAGLLISYWIPAGGKDKLQTNLAGGGLPK